jgi:hypothetical protein
MTGSDDVDDGFGSIPLKNSIVQEPKFLASAQRISQLTLRIGEALVRWPVVARSTELRGPPRLKIRDASMGLEFLAQVQEKSFSSAPVKPARSRWCKSAALKV